MGYGVYSLLNIIIICYLSIAKMYDCLRQWYPDFEVPVFTCKSDFVSELR